jgi:hypothetical protein
MSRSPVFVSAAAVLSALWFVACLPVASASAASPEAAMGVSADAAASATSHGGKEPDTMSPRVVSVSPPPGSVVVGPGGLETVDLVFDEAVVVPMDAVRAWSLAGGELPVLTEVIADGTGLRLTLPTGVTADVVTIAVDYSVTDEAGNALDGETLDPMSPNLPSGDGRAGGPFVTSFHVLSGDATGDGVVDGNDLGALLDVFGEANDELDVTGDGVVDGNDLGVILNNFNAELPAGDGTAPALATVSPDPSLPIDTEIVEVMASFTEPVDGDRLSERSLWATSQSGELAVPASVVTGRTVNTATFIFDPPLAACERWRVSLRPSSSSDNKRICRKHYFPRQQRHEQGGDPHVRVRKTRADREHPPDGPSSRRGADAGRDRSA